MPRGDLAKSLEAMLALLDAARGFVLSRALRARALRAIARRRSARVAAFATLGIALSALLTIACPVALFVLAPLALGVPHLAADVRHLVLRRRGGPGFGALMLGGAAALLAVRALGDRVGLEPLFALRAELSIGLAWSFGAAALAMIHGGSARRLGPVLAILAALTVVAARAPFESQLVFAHAHNLVGVAIWIALFRTPRRHATTPVVLLVVVTAALLSSAALPLTRSAHGEGAFGLRLVDLGPSLAPGFPAGAALGLAYSYVFLQSVHYATWLGWIPQDDLRAQGTLTFRMTVRGWVRDFGAPALAMIALASAGFAAAALFDPVRARDLYVSLASFHGHLEIAAVAYLLVRGRACAPTTARVPA
jgi:hypothetical protein